jgi:ribonuclease T1
MPGMKRSGLAFGAAAAGAVLLAVLLLRSQPAPAPAVAPAAPGAVAQGPAGGPALPQGAGPVVRDVTVRDRDGRIAWRGEVDLAPVLARIARGERDPHRDDGTTFGNREGRLPQRSPGFYREYVVRTPGLRSVGPQRLVVGEDGAAWYTPDHYGSFVQVRRAHAP